MRWGADCGTVLSCVIARSQYYQETRMEKRLEKAIREAMRCRNPKPKASTKGRTGGGLVRMSMNLSPEEVAMVRKLADEFRVSVNLVIRSLIRCYRKTPIDGEA